MKPVSIAWLLISLFSQFASAETLFFEAETMRSSSNGWAAITNDQTQRASRVKTMWGADGDGNAVATKSVRIGEAARYRIWVRYMQVAAWRGPFIVAVAAGGDAVGEHIFDREIVPDVDDWEYTWQSFETDLPAGDVTLTLAKHEQKNCVSYVRHVDCLLLTTDDKLVPNHLPFAPQTLMRVSVGNGYERPVYLHLFADHYRSPWYEHFAIGRDGIQLGLAPNAEQMLKSGDIAPWCNLTQTLYQDSGAALNLSIRYAYHEKAANFRATLEFGRLDNALIADDNVEIIKTFNIEANPNGLVIIAPPNLESPEHVALLKRDVEFAEEVGKLADAFAWPTHGRRPVKIPFLVSAQIGGYDMPVDAAVTQREQRTLNYFGFNGANERIVHGLWLMKDGSYCQPDIDSMRSQVKLNVAQFRESGRRTEEIAACMLMDEPAGQDASLMAKDEGYIEHFRKWVKTKSLTPADLLVANWDEVRPVVETDRDQFPALHYYTQLFRTRALGDFMVTQRQVIEEAYGHTFPTLVNFSDGAVYHGNFCGQGVDYFELLDADDQNAIWGEDWANNSSTYQCGSFNVALMQSAARKRGQTIGQYLIAHAGRTPWDIKTKATSETARGVRTWMNFSYGPNWSSHEGGPAWRSHLWHAKPELWTANAEITREIGAIEEWLLTAKPAPAEAALLYSSSSDIWTMQSNLAFGFDRMHTWLALTHSQMPFDILPEREFDRLDQYKVCYLSGPNISRDAATKLRAWVESGGTLWLTAGAASRDECNRPLDTVPTLLPVERGELSMPEPFHNAGRFLSHLKPIDTVTWSGEPLEVLSVKQSLVVRIDRSDMKSEILATFNDGRPAAVSGQVGKGQVVVLGFLPALSYIKPALVERQLLEQQPDQELLRRSFNPMSFPAGIRHRLLTPVRLAKLSASLICDTPLVDAVELDCERGALIALSNQTLRPLDRVSMQLKTKLPIVRVDSVRHGSLAFDKIASDRIGFSLPLDASDFVTVSTDPAEPHAKEPAELHVGKLPVSKVLFLGNSITLHSPAPNIGWTGNWGMAASAQDNDYVHVLLNQITKETGGRPKIMVKNIADFERRLTEYDVREELKQELAFEADLIIVALGENAQSPESVAEKAKFALAFRQLFEELKKRNAPTLIVRSQFWQDVHKDQLMKQASEDARAIFVDISKLGFDASNFARAERKIENDGVAGHPGDKGMQALANALWHAIKRESLVRQTGSSSR